MKKIKVALAGNPNSGKTTIFNALTGGRQHVGNYPGVTVEKKEGKAWFGDYEMTIVDLPGTYSLTAYSPDEVVSRKVLLEEKIDLIINIVDASNAERSLNLTVQLMELGLPMVLALNMLDVASAKGVSFDYSLLAKLLGMQVVPVVGTKNQGVDKLLETAVLVLEGHSGLSRRQLRYDRDLETAIRETEIILGQTLLPRRWLAVKLLENDSDVIARTEKNTSKGIISRVEKLRNQLTGIYGRDPEMVIVENRFAFVRGALREAEKVAYTEGLTVTEKIDRVILNRFLGLPVFLAVMWFLFQFTFSVGEYPGVWIGMGFDYLRALFLGLLPDGLFRSLIVDGIIGGVGGVLVFLPNIVLLYLGITILEATGYMARAAFVVDRLMHKMGLHGKSFIPMMLGFGCSIPAVMATRTLENPRDRLATTLVIPLMSCGARLPVYTLMAGAFFSTGSAGTVVFSIYLIGILLAVMTAKILRISVLAGPSEPFVMELPDYRMPIFRNVMIQVGERAVLYLKKAGTFILAASILLWALFTFPIQPESQSSAPAAVHMEESYAGSAGKIMEPILQPLGFDWKSGVSLLAGLAAKEVVVSTMTTIYSIEEGDLQSEGHDRGLAQAVREQSGFTPLTAYAFMLFVLIYVPCISTMAVVYRETNGWRWPAFLAAYTLALAWIVSFLAYRGGLLLGLR